MQFSVIKTLPFKNIPNQLIYHPEGSCYYKMFDRNNGKVLGFMEAGPISLNGNNLFYIDKLFIFQKRMHFGTKFLDFAVNLSNKQGCNGKLMLKASNTAFDPHNPPHIFYRKYGFTCSDKKMLKKIDKYIKMKKQLDYKNTPSVFMYFPEEKKSQIPILQKLKELLNI